MSFCCLHGQNPCAGDAAGSIQAGLDNIGCQSIADQIFRDITAEQFHSFTAYFRNQEFSDVVLYCMDGLKKLANCDEDGEVIMLTCSASSQPGTAVPAFSAFLTARVPPHIL